MTKKKAREQGAALVRKWIVRKAPNFYTEGVIRGKLSMLVLFSAITDDERAAAGKALDDKKDNPTAWWNLCDAVSYTEPI